MFVFYYVFGNGPRQNEKGCAGLSYATFYYIFEYFFITARHPPWSFWVIAVLRACPDRQEL